MILTSPDRLPENVRVLPIVIPELKLRDIEREILTADLVERSDHETSKFKAVV